MSPSRAAGWGVIAIAVGLVFVACSGGEGSPTISAPSTPALPTTVAGKAAALDSLLLRAADVPTRQAAVSPTISGLQVCGTRFPETSGATGQATVSFAAAGADPSIDETAARYPGATAAQLTADFRNRATRCGSVTITGATFQVRPLAPPTAGDDTAGVSLEGAGRSAALIVVRYGSDLAWVALSGPGGPIAEPTVRSVTSRTADRLAGL
jgi:hypothetical protein